MVDWFCKSNRLNWMGPFHPVLRVDWRSQVFKLTFISIHIYSEACESCRGNFSILLVSGGTAIAQ